MTETAYAGKPTPCQWCGLIHTASFCPMVKALEYYPDGTLKRVELKTAADYPQAIEWGNHLMGEAYKQI